MNEKIKEVEQNIRTFIKLNDNIDFTLLSVVCHNCHLFETISDSQNAYCKFRLIRTYRLIIMDTKLKQRSTQTDGKTKYYLHIFI